MDSRRWLEYLGGVIKVRIRGSYPEKVINLALARGIHLMEIMRSGDELILTMRSSALPAMQGLARQYGFTLEVESRQGWPYYKDRLRRRWAMLAGAVVFAVGLYILSSFVWWVEITGTHAVKPEKIALIAARYGLYEGASKVGLKINDIENGILRDEPRLSYVEINLHGVKATIKVVEKVLPEQNQTGPADIVARKGGIVEDVFVLSGEPRVKKGDVVKRGDVLISGLVHLPPGPNGEEAEPEIKITQARGSVRARVWYEGYGEHPLEKTITLDTGRKSSAWKVTTPWFELGSEHPNNGFQSYRQKADKWIWKSPWGALGLIRTTRLETTARVLKYSEKEALRRAANEAYRRLMRNMKDTERVLRTESRIVSSPSDTIIRVKIMAEVLEDIGEPQALRLEEERQENEVQELR